MLGADAGPAELAKMLIAAGWPEATPFAVTWDGTTSAQQTVTSTLGRIGPDLKAAGVSLANTPARPWPWSVRRSRPRDTLSWFETKPLFGWRVLVPRTKEQAAVVSRAAARVRRGARGGADHRGRAAADAAADGARGQGPGHRPLPVGRLHLGQRGPAIREKFEEYGLDARAFAGVKVAAVGEQTAAALLDFGIRPDLVPEGEQSAEGLAEAWPPYDDVLDPINRVLLPRADIATETLVAGLIDLGWEAEDVTAYRTVRAAPPPAPVREAIKGGGFDAVLFTSSSTVRNLVGIAGKPHAVTVIGGHRPADGQDRGRVRPAGGRHGAQAVDGGAGRGAGRVRRRPAGRSREAGEPVRRPSERRRGARRRTVR